MYRISQFFAEIRQKIVGGGVKKPVISLLLSAFVTAIPSMGGAGPVVPCCTSTVTTNCVKCFGGGVIDEGAVMNPDDIPSGGGGGCWCEGKDMSSYDKGYCSSTATLADGRTCGQKAICDSGCTIGCGINTDTCKCPDNKPILDEDGNCAAECTTGDDCTCLDIKITGGIRYYDRPSCVDGACHCYYQGTSCNYGYYRYRTSGKKPDFGCEHCSYGETVSGSGYLVDGYTVKKSDFTSEWRDGSAVQVTGMVAKPMRYGYYGKKDCSIKKTDNDDTGIYNLDCTYVP